MRVLHHPERGADPEDLPPQADLPADEGADQPDDPRAVDGRAVPAADPARGAVLAADAGAAGRNPAVHGILARARPDRGDPKHVLPRLRPPRVGVPPGLVLRHA